MNRSVFIKVAFIQGACEYIQSVEEGLWAENIADQVLQVFVRNVHQINVVFEGSKLRILRTDDTVDLELSSFDHEFRDFGLACLAVTNFYDVSMRHASETLVESQDNVKPYIAKNDKFDPWPV